MLMLRMRELPPDATLWINAAGERMTAGDIANWPEGALFRGKSVALWFSDSSLLARAVLALDGPASRFLLLAPGTASELAAQLIGQFGADAVLTDANAEQLTADPSADVATAWV